MAILEHVLLVVELASNIENIKLVFNSVGEHKEAITTVILIYDRYLLTKMLRSNRHYF